MGCGLQTTRGWLKRAIPWTMGGMCRICQELMHVNGLLSRGYLVKDFYQSRCFILSPTCPLASHVPYPCKIQSFFIFIFSYGMTFGKLLKDALSDEYVTLIMWACQIMWLIYFLCALYTYIPEVSEVWCSLTQWSFSSFWEQDLQHLCPNFKIDYRYSLLSFSGCLYSSGLLYGMREVDRTNDLDLEANPVSLYHVHYVLGRGMALGYTSSRKHLNWGSGINLFMLYK